MAPQYKLTYFGIKGLAEPIRFLLSYMNAEFEDIRINKEQWPTIKPSTPFGKLPILEVDGKKLSQSTAISRYLGRKAGLAGENEWEDLQIDIAIDTLKDFAQELIMYAREEDEKQKAQKLEILKTETVSFYFRKLDELIMNSNGYLANGKLSWGDIYLVALINGLQDHTKFGSILQSFPFSTFKNFEALYHSILSIPQIKFWVDNRPKDIPL